MPKVRFEWDDRKDKVNQKKHNVSFSLAQNAFLDPNPHFSQHQLKKAPFPGTTHL